MKIPHFHQTPASWSYILHKVCLRTHCKKARFHVKNSISSLKNSWGTSSPELKLLAVQWYVEVLTCAK